MTKPLLLIASMSGLVLAACGDNGVARTAGPDVSGERAIVVAGDFTEGHPGMLSMLDLASGTVQANVGPAMAVGADPILRHFGHELFIVNRLPGHSVTILDDQTLAFQEELGTGANSNPQDVAVVGDKLYVPTLGNAGVTVLTRGSTSTRLIDLSADDEDGNPDCNSVYVVGRDLYVSCELLEFTDMMAVPRGPGKIYVVDTTTDTVKTALTLTLGHANPFGLFEQIPVSAPHGGDLVMPTVLFRDGTGCVERITPGATPSAPGCLVDNTELGGYASRVDVQADPAGAVMFFAAPIYPLSNLRAFDLPSSAFWTGPLNPSTQVIGDLAVCPEGEIVVSDTTKNVNGLRLYNGGTELTTAPIAVGMLPQSSHGLICY